MDSAGHRTPRWGIGCCLQGSGDRVDGYEVIGEAADKTATAWLARRDARRYSDRHRRAKPTPKTKIGKDPRGVKKCLLEWGARYQNVTSLTILGMILKIVT
ncbi:hypothetical protein HNP84_009462 [Thermocatellispora tengchongensis]|uniref:Uncharacterized protein n=1 Tax=Thermocatellispora tengchongensis TaxID=1073253 RepID=A0A840PJJ3_9ACTN|nr:hypothetical protein [Thermocatellispora tengchongensis]MBB5139698.1 hypothetical protein [Thermocatellispora tengchongensis]